MTIRDIPAALLAAILLPVYASAQEYPDRLAREDSFFGIHFDFHAGPDCDSIGVHTDEGMVRSVIDLVHPDYIQIDCKGHAGYSSYPTEAGNRAPGITGDPLMTWREVTAENGIALYMHYSGVWDARAVELHPEWAITGPDGKRSEKITSVFGPYQDRLMIPQIKELAGKYKVDGVWIDGECWGTAPDYGEIPVRMFKEMTGAEEAPLSPDQPYWHEWKQFHRDAFKSYMRHYLAVIRSEYPDLQLCSNWAFSHHMPEAVSASPDFLSGDYSPENSVNSARVAARYLSQQGLPWDLMAWSFGFKDNTRYQKPAIQLMRESAVALALGGGIQFYFMQNRDGSVQLDELGEMDEISDFIRSRQQFCHHSKQIPQVALLLSTFDYSHYDAPEDPSWLYPQHLEGISGILQCLLENQYSVDVVGEHTLLPGIERFPLVVIPECDTLPVSFCQALLNYAEEGGRLLVTGEKMSRMISGIAGIRYPSGKCQVFRKGSGEIGFINEDISCRYDTSGSPELRGKVRDIVRRLFPEPLVEVTGSPYVDVSASTLNGRQYIHLVNTSGDHRNTSFIDRIDPTGPLTVEIRCTDRPEAIIRQPYGEKCDFTYRNGKARFVLDSLEIYDIIEIR